MTIELINGKAGEPHIDGNDIGMINLAFRGDGSYVFRDFGDTLAATVTDNNHVTIGTGVLSMEGRDTTVTAAETVQIDSGSQGMVRNDLICLHYHRDTSSNVETMNLEVLKGTAVSGTASDPTVPTGSIMDGATDAYMPLYRIPLDGITVGTPVAIFDTMRNVRDSVTPKLLWSGSWSSGSITVDGLSDYQLFGVELVGIDSDTTWAARPLVFSNPQNASFVGGNISITEGGNAQLNVVRATRDGNTLTLRPSQTGAWNSSSEKLSAGRVTYITGIA